MPYAEARDGARLYYEEGGTGDPLLLIPPQGMDHHSWDGVRDDFVPEFRVVDVDLRGTGNSDRPTAPPYTTRGFAQDLIAVLDHLGISRTHAYGASMGGRVAQWLGIDHSDRLGALVLGATMPGNAHGVRRPPKIDAIFQALMTNPRAIQAMTNFLLSPQWVAAHPEYVAALAGNMRQRSPADIQRLHYIASEQHDAWARLPEITAPTLVIHGTEDQVNMTANAPLLAARIPGAKLHLIQGARHLYYVEFRSEASRVVKNFLRQHPISAAPAG